MSEAIDSFLESLDSPLRETMDAVRAAVSEADPRLAESIKWNAPSFSLSGQDRITLGIERKGGVHIVLHRGAKPTGIEAFRFDDPDRLARWPAPDRGVILFKDRGQVDAVRSAFVLLCRRWISQTT